MSMTCRLCREITCQLGIFRIKLGVSPWLFHQIRLILHAKIQKNIRKNSILEKKALSLHLNYKIIGEFEYEKDEIYCCGTLYAARFRKLCN